MSKVPHIKVDATVIVNDIISGVGHYSLGIIEGFDQIAGEGKLTYSLMAPWRRSKRIKKTNLKHYKKIIRFPIPEKYLNGFRYFHVPAPLDLLFGPGKYYFPHFRSYPMWFSKSAVVIHDMTYTAHPDYVNKKHLRYLRRVVPGSAKSASAVIVPSEFSKQELAKYLKINPQKIWVAYPSVDRKHFKPSSDSEITRVKAKYDIFSDDYLLSVGNIEPRKNYSKLIDAYLSLPKTLCDKYPLIIVGADSWNNHDILDKIQKAKEDGYKIIHPKQFVADEDMPALYSGAKLLVFVPLYEGFGMPPLESYACGTPVIASSAASVPEAAGVAAVYVDPHDSHDIASKIKSTIEELDKNPHKYDGLIKEHLANHSSWRHSAEITAAALTGQPVENFQKRN